MKKAFTKADIEKVYDEVDRRVSEILDSHYNARIDVSNEDIDEMVKCMLLGVYGTLMALSSNWPDIRTWTDEIERERYAFLQR